MSDLVPATDVVLANPNFLDAASWISMGGDVGYMMARKILKVDIADHVLDAVADLLHQQSIAGQPWKSLCG